MEQYWMPKKLDFQNLRYCIDNHEADSLFIRLVGSHGGTVRAKISLEGIALDFRRDKFGLLFLTDQSPVRDKEGKVVVLPLKDYDKGFSLAYERILDDGVMHILGGIPDDPYDPNLPEPRLSFLRNVWDNHLIEIYFKGRIPVKFHSWWQRPHFKYWTVATQEEGAKLKHLRGLEEAVKRQEKEYAEDDSEDEDAHPDYKPH
ncbi:hypothetical protein JW711_04020 [Candidatus Woesearchaeota archaeon]|nr:hypothetical protein [Candidatus Woesearchaeota archaeon]